MNEFKLPKNVQAAIDAYKQVESKMQQRRESVEDRKQRLQQELSETEEKLKQAMAVTLDNPTKANEEKETELRRKVADLKMAIAGAEERSNFAFYDGMDESKRLAKEAIALAKTEAERYFNENINDKLVAIKEAKYAYLKALVDAYDLKQDAYRIWRETGQLTNPNYLENTDSPYLNNDIYNIPLTMPYHGLHPNEVVRAASYGVIETVSCGKDRATKKGL